ncbi:CU044_5270 family protein [Paractinoplanes atraurantiacus]|uniref:Uncharacterized protein n=1 Tax=Paractinoplanes atraurantiacus TaxID=1036182 RepID=A0A285JUG2_9ACTN|nr:CU044_5270 family protein [Actinoplanes atraurantiacus]SNY63959.1 hypothetical protein SAMN05421748_12610 [Actinoplanes atraurantiacus]
MDETTLTRQLGEQTALPSPERLAPARERLLAELTADLTHPEPASQPQRTFRAPRALRSRNSFRLAVAVASAAAVAAFGAIALRGPAPDRPPVAMAPVAEFLGTAAAVAARDRDVTPRGDQFVYVKTAGADGTWFEQWNSVDGEHDSVGRSSDGREEVLPACVDGLGKSTDSAGKAVSAPCDVHPWFLPDLPADPEALIAWLTKRNSNVNGVAKDLWSLADGYWLRPAQRAALYRAVGMVDGISLVPSAEDAAGRVGTGVAWVSPGRSVPEVMWIFDAETHLLLGSPATSVVTQPRIVDEVGERS